MDKIIQYFLSEEEVIDAMLSYLKSKDQSIHYVKLNKQDIKMNQVTGGMRLTFDFSEKKDDESTNLIKFSNPSQDEENIVSKLKNGDNVRFTLEGKLVDIEKNECIVLDVNSKTHYVPIKNISFSQRP